MNSAMNVLHTVCACPEVMATYPNVRESIGQFALKCSIYWNNDNSMLAALEEFHMFMDGLDSYAFYKE
jgi:hypothetical protein